MGLDAVQELERQLKAEQEIYKGLLKQVQDSDKATKGARGHSAATVPGNFLPTEGASSTPSHIKLEKVIDPTYAILGYLGNATDIACQEATLSKKETLSNMFYLASFYLVTGRINEAVRIADGFRTRKPRVKVAELDELGNGDESLNKSDFMVYLSSKENAEVCARIITKATTLYDQGKELRNATRPEFVDRKPIDNDYAQKYAELFKQHLILSAMGCGTAQEVHKS
jgi:hypothetical protein